MKIQVFVSESYEGLIVSDIKGIRGGVEWIAAQLEKRAVLRLDWRLRRDHNCRLGGC